MEKDPVCGMEVVPERAAARVDHGGRTWWFCSEACRQTFEQDPDRYVRAAGAAAGRHGEDRPGR